MIVDRALAESDLIIEVSSQHDTDVPPLTTPFGVGIQLRFTELWIVFIKTTGPSTSKGTMFHWKGLSKLHTRDVY